MINCNTYDILFKNGKASYSFGYSREIKKF